MDPTNSTTMAELHHAGLPQGNDTIELINGAAAVSAATSSGMENFNNSSCHHKADVNDHAPPSSQQQQQHRQLTTYDDLFPSLPASNTAMGSNPQGMWNKKPLLMGTTVTQVFHIPMEERRGQSTGGFGANDSSKILKAVMEKTGSTIEMASSKDQSLTFLIRGKQDAVLRARRELSSQFLTQASSQIAIPKEHHKYILGKGGSKLQELEVRTGTKISMPRTVDASDQITITGCREGIEKAVHEIQLVSDQQSKQAYEVVWVPKMFHPFINGAFGENVRKMLAEHPNVRINIPPIGVLKDEITVAGEKEGVMKVVETINRIFADMERRSSTVSVEVKKSQHRYVIGPKRNSINEILAETGVSVEMPSADSPSETITLRGPQEKLGPALTKVYEKANSVVSYDIPCPIWLHKYIIGKKGSGIQKLTSELPKVHVEFLDVANTIKIEGPPEEADKARDQLEAQVRDLTRKMDFADISVDAKYHKHIIGKGGSTVNKLKQDSDVMIIIPDVDQGMAVIRIEGSKAGVSKAKAELENLVRKMENEKETDLVIENRFHRQLIGPKGENIQKIRDDFGSVQISFPDLGVNSDIVKLRGPRDEVDKCVEMLSKLHKDLLQTSYQVKVPIFRQFHKKIIGKGGATIKQLRQETNTKIDFPESGSDSDVVLITGRKQDVDEARRRMQKIQTEMADVVSVKISVPAKIHNSMIGTGGKLIQSIMDDCGGVSINFPSSGSGSDEVTISGPKDDVEKAKEILVNLSREKQLSRVTAEVRAKPEHHKFLIGRHGANIQEVRDKTGARITFPSEADKDREVITIIGTKEAVEAAKAELQKRIVDLDNVVESIMTVDPKHHRYFVLKRGEVLKQIGEEFGGVVVSFPRNGVASDKVTLKGAKDCVDGAKKRIEELVHNLDCQVTTECVIPQQHHRTIMGARGCHIQKICSDFDVQIKIPDRKQRDEYAENGGATLDNNNSSGGSSSGSSSVGSGDIIRVSGKKENCEAAVKALEALVPVNIEVEIPFEYHRFIIGQKGAGIRHLMNTYDVNIKVPSSEQNSSVVVITGPAANVEGAKAGLLERLRELEEDKADRDLKSFVVKVDVKPEYHPKIIGRKGAVISQLRADHDVVIQLPKREDPDQSTITITGYEAKANEAKEAILKIVHDFESLCKEEVEVDHRVHSMIIGRRGVGIRRIMQEYKVDIKLPREGDANPDLVTIVGSEDGVLDCKDHLLNLQEELLQDAIDYEALKAYEQAPLKQMQRNNEEQRSRAEAAAGKGFEIAKGAPWQGATDDAFPSLGNGQMAAAATAMATASVASIPVWGPKR